MMPIRSHPILPATLLDARSVNDLLTRVDHLGLVHYSRAGSAVRIDWRLNDLGEVVRAAA
jgi:hypothetical protein